MGISTEKATIMGARPAKGDVDGVQYDYTELYVLENIDPSSGFGGATVPIKFGDSKNFEIFRGLKSPQIADIDLMTVTNGRGTSKRIVTAVRIQKTA